MAGPRKIALRLCVGCNEMRPKKELIRIVRTVQETVEVDATGKRAGRGAYICPREDCLDRAIKGRRLERALRHRIDAELATHLREEIKKRASGTQTPGPGAARR